MLDYLKKLNDIQSFQDGILFYGMWNGYKDKTAMKELLDFMISSGVRIHTLHTSGHADSKTIDRLIDAVSTNTIMPVQQKIRNGLTGTAILLRLFINNLHLTGCIFV